MSLFKQAVLFGGCSDDEDSKYSKKIEAPIYKPRDKKPHILELTDISKTNSIIREIISCNDITQEERQFLIESAYRHTIFNYEKIADYYTKASPQMKKLMEKSALVIIDFNKAIEEGYVNLCDEIRSQHLEHSE